MGHPPPPGGWMELDFLVGIPLMVCQAPLGEERLWLGSGVLGRGEDGQAGHFLLLGCSVLGLV